MTANPGTDCSKQHFIASTTADEEEKPFLLAYF